MTILFKLRLLVSIVFFSLIALLAVGADLFSLSDLLPKANAQAAPAAFTRTADTGFVPCGNTADNPCTFRHMLAAMIAIINYLIATAGFLAVAMIIYAGLRMIWARGDASKLTEAKGRLSGAVIGVVLVSVAFLLINAMFSGSLSLGIKDGALILSNPIEYIGKANKTATSSSAPSDDKLKNKSICINRNTGAIDKLINDKCPSGMVKSTAVIGLLFCVYDTSKTSVKNYEPKTATTQDKDSADKECKALKDGKGSFNLKDYQPTTSGASIQTSVI